MGPLLQQGGGENRFGPKNSRPLPVSVVSERSASLSSGVKRMRTGTSRPRHHLPKLWMLPRRNLASQANGDGAIQSETVPKGRFPAQTSPSDRSHIGLCCAPNCPMLEAAVFLGLASGPAAEVPPAAGVKFGSLLLRSILCIA